MDLWQAIVLGLVEGLTEFLPISSTGHLTIIEKLMGFKIDDPDVTAFTAIIQSGAVLATLGAGGAVLVTPEGAWHAAPPPTEVVSTVGAGDSSLFGYVLADLRGEPPAHRLALAVAYGSAAAGLPGTTIPEPSHVDPGRVRVSPLHDHPGARA